MSSARVTDERAEVPPDDPLDDDGTAEASGGGRSGRHRALLAVLSVLVVGLLVALVVLGIAYRRSQSEQHDRRDAVTAAEQQAVNITSLSSKDVDASLKRVVDNGTGQFKQEYDEQVGRLRDALVSQEITATSEVVDSAVVRSDEDSALVLVVVDASVANKAQPQPTPRRYRLQVEMTREGGRWLTSALTIL